MLFYSTDHHGINNIINYPKDEQHIILLNLHRTQLHFYSIAIILYLHQFEYPPML